MQATTRSTAGSHAAYSVEYVSENVAASSGLSAYSTNSTAVRIDDRLDQWPELGRVVPPGLDPHEPAALGPAYALADQSDCARVAVVGIDGLRDDIRRVGAVLERDRQCVGVDVPQKRAGCGCSGTSDCGFKLSFCPPYTVIEAGVMYAGGMRFSLDAPRYLFGQPGFGGFGRLARGATAQRRGCESGRGRRRGLFSAELSRAPDDRPVRIGTVMGLRRGKVYVQLDDPPVEVKLYPAQIDPTADVTPDGAALRGATLRCRLGDAVHLRLRTRDPTGRWHFDLRDRP